MNAVLSPTTTNSNTNLAELAAKINGAHASTLRLADDLVRKARECGEALLAAKQQVPHGEFGKWIDDNCPNVGRRQAQKYLRIHREWPAIEHAAEGEVRSIAGLLALIASPTLNANSETHLEETEWLDDDAVPVTVTNDRLSSAVGGGSGNEMPPDAIRVPLPNPGERLVAHANPHATIEILRSGEDTYFVTVFSSEGFFDHSKKHVFGFMVADQLLGLSSLNAGDLVGLEWQSEPQEPLPERYHPLHDGEESWLGPNPNTRLYWLTKLSL
jgi:hypothetical protein